MELLFWLIAGIHLITAFYVTVSINESFFITSKKKMLYRILVWLIPLFGAFIVRTRLQIKKASKSGNGGFIDGAGGVSGCNSYSDNGSSGGCGE